MTFVKRPKKRLKQIQTEVAETKEKVAEVISDPQVSAPENMADKALRDVKMFREWLSGKTYKQLAVENDLSICRLFDIAKKYKWKDLKKELLDRQFRAALARTREIAIFTQDALAEDIKNFVSKAREGKRDLTKEERDHLRAMYDRILKEIRLDEGKPTDIGNNGTVQVEIVLPPGVRRFGLVPPSPNVKTIEKPPIEVNSINLDDIEDQND